jgi:anhydro-N-acetylmuramic acid kinase
LKPQNSGYYIRKTFSKLENMNPFVKKLAAIASKKSRTIIGLMSGTSLDGLDIALCRISGSGENTVVELLEFCTKVYNEDLIKRLRSISSVRQVDMGEVCREHTMLATHHSQLILEALDDWGVSPGDIDCIGSHGQTIYHLPARDQHGVSNPVNSTFQIGDGDHIAARTGILTISDFRQKHTAFGGEGAPMAGLVDRILFGDKTESRVLLNIGGIGNYTWLPADNQKGLGPFTTDTGPGNTLIDSLAKTCFQKPYDEDGQIAASGKINRKLLRALLEDPWFGKERAKSTGPEYFNLEWILKRAGEAGVDVEKIPPADRLATVTELTAITIAENIRKEVDGFDDSVIYLSGGGAHNRHLVSRIKEHLNETIVRNLSEFGYDPDAKEAMIFAVLANEMLAGEGFEFENGEGTVRKLNFGKISFPR